MPIPADGNRKITHPLFATWAPTWIKMLDIFEGAGGFLDEERPYLIPHPREWLDHSVINADGSTSPKENPTQPSAKLKMRRKLARYENLAETILSAVTASLFAQPATRMVGDGKNTTQQPIEQFWGNVDGKGTSIDTFLQDAWTVAGVFGHAIVVMEKSDEEATTLADAKMPRLCRYTPLDLIDWLVDEESGQLTAVKLLEPAPRKDFSPVKSFHVQVRVITETDWTLYDHGGNKIDGAAHGFGCLPVAILYGKRRPFTPVIGKPVLGDPMLFIDAYNLISEVRELLRNQTFAILNVPLGKDGSVETEQAKLGSQSGTANVLFSTEKADFIAPPGDNVAAYHEHLDRLGRMIYRLASVPWEGDSKVAESADSRRLKRQELISTLSKYASELHSTETRLIELVYRAVHGAEGYEAKLEADRVSVQYPDTFEAPDLKVLADTTAAALGLDLGETAAKALKKQTAREFLPHIDAETQDTIDQEIDAQTILSEEEKRQEEMDLAVQKMAGRPFGKGAAA